MRWHLLPRALAVLPAQDKGGGRAVDALRARAPVAAEPRQREHGVLLAGGTEVRHRAPGLHNVMRVSGPCIWFFWTWQHKRHLC